MDGIWLKIEIHRVVVSESAINDLGMGHVLTPNTCEDHSGKLGPLLSRGKS
jgi:hypothetical protein